MDEVSAGLIGAGLTFLGTLISSRVAPKSIGRLFFAKQIREATALEAFLEMSAKDSTAIREVLQESIIGWRESTASVGTLSSAMGHMQGSIEDMRRDGQTYFHTLRDGYQRQERRLERIEGILNGS